MASVETGLGYNDKRNFILDAEARLANLGLSVQALDKYENVLDIGAADCAIERAALSRGVQNVTSVDRNFKVSPEDKQNLRLLERDAASLGLPDQSVDLVLVLSSAYNYTKTEEETLKILEELQRVLKKGGRQLIHPARFGHIVEVLKNERPEFKLALQTERSQRTRQQAEIIVSSLTIANQRTLDFLKTKSFSAKEVKGYTTSPLPSFEQYLQIDKL